MASGLLQVDGVWFFHEKKRQVNDELSLAPEGTSSVLHHAAPEPAASRLCSFSSTLLNITFGFPLLNPNLNSLPLPGLGKAKLSHSVRKLFFSPPSGKTFSLSPSRVCVTVCECQTREAVTFGRCFFPSV